MPHPKQNSSTSDPDRFDRERSNLEREPSSVADDRPPRSNRIAEDDPIIDDEVVSEDDVEDEGLGRSDR
jgi:hypothetical protein